jgi:putative membrane protein
MRWFYLTVIILLASATITFAAQNFQSVTVSFFLMSAQTPLAFAVVYLLGAATGGTLLALLRRSIEGSRRRGTD